MCSNSPLYSPGLLTSISPASEERIFQMRHHVVAEGPDLRVVPLRGGVLSPGKEGASWDISLPSASHLTLPPSITLTFSWPNRRKTQRAYVAHQLFLSP